MSVYSNKQIRKAIADGHIICHPFDERNVNGASLDITLGYHYYRIESVSQRAVYSPFDRDDIERYFDGPYQALPHSEWCRLNGIAPLAGIPGDHPIIALRPGERILAHTHEFFGIAPPGVCEIKGKAQWQQSGITVCSGSNWMEPGEIARATLAISNTNQSKTMLLPVGERIAQAVYSDTGEIDAGQGITSDSGQYQTAADLETIIRTWSPSRILPRTDLGQRSLPRKIEGLSYE